MIRVPRLPAQRLPKLRRGIRVHCDRIADRQMRQPAQQHDGRAEQHRMRPIRAQQRAVFCREHIQPSIQPGFQQAEKQLKQARHAQRQDDCFKCLTAGQKRLIQAVRVAHADRNHLPRAARPGQGFAEVDVVVAAAQIQIHKQRPRRQHGAQRVFSFYGFHLFFVT